MFFKVGCKSCKVLVCNHIVRPVGHLGDISGGDLPLMLAATSVIEESTSISVFDSKRVNATCAVRDSYLVSVT